MLTAGASRLSLSVFFRVLIARPPFQVSDPLDRRHIPVQRQLPLRRQLRRRPHRRRRPRPHVQSQAIRKELHLPRRRTTACGTGVDRHDRPRQRRE